MDDTLLTRLLSMLAADQPLLQCYALLCLGNLGFLEVCLALVSISQLWSGLFQLTCSLQLMLRLLSWSFVP